jgi:hypothetical protein
MDAMGGFKAKRWATLALVALSSAFSYSLGLQQGGNESKHGWAEAPIDPKTVMLMRDAAARARDEGDPSTAEWFDTVAQSQMEQMVSWVANGRQSRTAAAAARGE